MILDERLEFADAASVAAAAGTALIGDVIDTGIVGTSLQPNDLGVGEALYVVIQTDTAIVTGGSAGTIQLFLVSDALATLGGGSVGSCTTHLTSASLATGASASGALAAGGTILAARLPAGTYERYLGILCTIGTTPVTAGKINAFLTNDVSRLAAYADAAN